MRYQPDVKNVSRDFFFLDGGPKDVISIIVIFEVFYSFIFKIRILKSKVPTIGMQLFSDSESSIPKFLRSNWP